MSDSNGHAPKPTPAPEFPPEPEPAPSPYDANLLGSISLWGAPNSYIDRRHGQWRYYGPDGRALEDYDQPHNGHNYWHKHKWEWKDGVAHRGKDPIKADPPKRAKQKDDVTSISKIVGNAIVIGAGILTAILIVDNITGICTIDDILIPVTTSWYLQGLSMLGG